MSKEQAVNLIVKELDYLLKKDGGIYDSIDFLYDTINNRLGSKDNEFFDIFFEAFNVDLYPIEFLLAICARTSILSDNKFRKGFILRLQDYAYKTYGEEETKRLNLGRYLKD